MYHLKVQTSHIKVSHISVWTGSVHRHNT